jgi:UDP-glucose 4-epimerase
MMNNGCRKIVYFSSGGTVYGNNGKDINSETDALCPLNYYGYSKLALEEFYRLSSRIHKINHIIIRPSNPYGAGQNLFGKQGLITVSLGRILQNKPIEIWGDGKVIRDYIHIQDLSKATNSLIESDAENQVFNIGSGIGHSVNEIIEMIHEVTGKDTGTEFKPARPVDIPVNILSIDKITSATQWQPSIKLKDGIALLWNEMRLNAHQFIA